ncbi:MAG: DNA ligase D, partial [Flavisolibacter sp.]
MKKPKTFSPGKALQSLLKEGKASPIPGDLEPMLATLVDAPAEGEDWFYEMKWDGYRCIAYLNNGTVTLRSRNNKSFDEKFYPVRQAFEQLNIKAVIDGEIIVLNEKGLPDFSDLQLWRSEDDGRLAFYAFDLLWVEGYSLMHLPLEKRKKILESILPVESPMIRFSETLDATGDEAFQLAEQFQLEGVMAKKAGSIYSPGKRSKDWLKIKTEKRQEFIIGGYTLNEGSNKLFSALLLGIIEKGEFKFVTPVGTGFNLKMQELILKKLKPLETNKCPFSSVPEYNKPSRFRPNPPKATVTWVKPKIVAEISYREMTKDGAVRHPSFKGLRDDKKPVEVVKEIPASTAEVTSDHKHHKKIIAAPLKKERKTLLNPKEESQTRPVGGHEIKFTNLSKVFWPAEHAVLKAKSRTGTPITKRDLINYYYQVAPFILPYIKDKPQTLNRHPHGINGQSFYQKDVKGKAPDWIETYPYYSHADQKEKEFLVCTHEASLLYIASLGCIEINPWSSRRQNPDNPDWCIIDLDPDNNSFEQVIEAANITKKVLDSIGVPSYPKTSGSTGIHIYIPFGAKYSYEHSKEFGRSLMKIVHAEIPGFTSIERKTADRKGCIYLDFLQNRPQATVAAPYSLRPKPGAPVSMPLLWEEVKKGLKMTDFHIHNAMDRLKETGDIFKPVLGKGIELEKAIKKMKEV